MTGFDRRSLAALGLPVLAALLASCSSPSDDEASKDAYLQYRWVVMGDGGAPIARPTTDASSPTLG